MNLGVPLEVMLSNETFLAMWTLVLSISEMGLHVGLDVFFSTEALLTIGIETKPFIVWTRAFNESGYIIDGDTSLGN